MLKTVLIANAASCAVFGALFLLKGTAIAAFLGDPPIWLLQVIGAGLMLNAAFLVFTASQTPPGWRSVYLFIAGDAIWVIATINLLTFGIFVTTPSGIWAAIGVAVFVGACGVGQYRYGPRRG